MKNVNLKNFTVLIVALSGGIWFLLAWFYGMNLGKARDFFGLVPKVVSIDVVLFGVFARWIWKWRLFRGWLVPFPDLNGTWIGKIQSNWVDPQTGQPVPEIPAMVTVKQTFFHVSCVMRTGEMKSHSYVEGFLIDNDRQVRQLAYSYTSRPSLSVAGRSSPHDGTAIFDIVELPERKLTGRYWTERKTTGEMKFQFHSKELLDELPTDIAQHPLHRPT